MWSCPERPDPLRSQRDAREAGVAGATFKAQYFVAEGFVSFSFSILVTIYERGDAAGGVPRTRKAQLRAS